MNSWNTNWFIILQIDVTPYILEGKSLTLNDIQKPFDERAAHWNKKLSSNKFCAAWQNQEARDIKNALEDGNRDLFIEHINAAKPIIDEKIDQKLRFEQVDGKISKDKIAKITKLKFDNECILTVGEKWVNSRIEENNYTITIEKDYTEIFKKYCKCENKFSSAESDLKLLEAKNFYKLIFPNEKIESAQARPVEELQKEADKLTKSLDRVATKGNNKTKQNLYSKAKTNIFKDKATKEKYDNYLKDKERVNQIEEIKAVYEQTEVALTVEKSKELISKIAHFVDGDAELARNIFHAYCQQKNIPTVLPKEGDFEILIWCDCGSYSEPSESICQSCGKKLIIECPNCHAKNNFKVNVCKCGHSFVNARKAESCCEASIDAIHKLDIDLAKMLLESAENHDPKCPKIANVRKELNAESVKKCSANRDSMLKAIDEKRYCQANKDLTEIRRLYPSFTCEYEAEINDSIAKATSFFNKAKAAKNDTDKITNCIQAHECCADLPGVEEQIPPPNKAKGFEIKPDVYKKVNVLKWASSNDNLSSYVVVKSDTNQVRRIEDGTVIYKGKSCTYTDKDIIAGNTYYYNLFVERAGRYSECADDKHDGVTSLFDISGVSATPGNKIVNLTWNSVAKGATVNIYIKENGAYKLAASSMSTSCVLSSLTNNKQYDIKIVVEYNISGKKVETTGTELTVVPIAPIKPIDDMRIKSPDKGKFELIWTKSDDGVVEIYSSTSMPSYKAGDMISVDELKKQMNVQPTKALSLNTATTLSPTENGATLEYNGDKPLYLMAVVVRLGSAVTGKIVRASNSGIINARSVDKINNKLHIIIDEPKADSGITEFIVLYSNKAFPLEVTDANAKRKVITKKKFDSEHKLIIDMCDFTCYYFSIFAKIEMDGETSYSPPINCHYNENKTAIAYSIKAKNSLFKKVLEVKMATNDMSDLPSIDIVCMEGRMPINRNEGKVIHSHQKANSVNSIVIPLDPAIIKKKNVYIKAFLTDKTLINKYSIKHPNNKIT